MSSYIYNLKRYESSSLRDVSNQIIDAFQTDLIVPELVINQTVDFNNHEVLLLCFEKFYFRTSSMAALTIQGISNGKEQLITVVSTGGGEGPLNISKGANSDFAYRTLDILERIGFKENRL